MYGIKFSSINIFNSTGRLNDPNSVCGNGEQTTETRQIAPFERIEAGGAIELVITTGKDTSLSISGESNILPLIATTVNQGELTIATKGSYQSNKSIRVMVTTASLKELSISGAGSVVAEIVDGDTLDLDFSGASNAILKGKIRELELDVSGAGSIDATALFSESVRADVSGAASIKVRASAAARVSVSGAASVEVFGSPAIRREKVSGAGSVRFRG
jgi:hypothetical protein